MSTPVKFLELSIRNFMSYGNNDTTLRLDFDKPTLIVGRNLDAVVNGQVDSNGSGKSAILDAISYALYDKTISDKDKSNLINVINKKNMQVSLTFEKDGVVYKVTRMRKSKTKADIRLYIMSNDNEWVDKTLDSISNNNDEIVRILGLPFDIFSRIIVFSASFEPFLNLPNRHTSKTSQTSIIEELFGYTELTDKADALKGEIKITKTSFTHVEELQTQIALEMKRHAQQVEIADKRVNDWDIQHAADIKSRTSSIETLSSVDFDDAREVLVNIDNIEASIKTANQDISTKNDKVRNLKSTLADHETMKQNYLKSEQKIKTSRDKVALIEDSVDFEQELEIIDEFEATRLEISALDTADKTNISTKKRLLQDIDKISIQVKHLDDDKCPYCEQTYVESGDKLKEIKDELATLSEQLVSVESVIQSTSNEVSELTIILTNSKTRSMFDGIKSDYDQMLNNYNKHKAIVDASIDVVDISEIDGKIQVINSDIDELNILIADGSESVDTLSNELRAAKQDSIFTNGAELERGAAKLESSKDALETLKADVNPHNDALSELEAVEFDNDRSGELNDINVVLEHQQFLLKLLTKKDSFVRKNLLDRSLPFLNKRLMTYLEQIGLPHRVEFLPDMSAQISQFGTALDFGSLSSGQRARVNLALAFAFRDVLQSHYGKISFCMLDECLDTGLGNVGVQLAATMIKNIAIEDNMSMFVISHRDEIANMFPNKLTVELQNGFSKIIN